MACGGIYPWYSGEAKEMELQKVEAIHRNCWFCHQNNGKHYVEEYQSFIHARCAVEFLTIDDVVVEHGHQVLLDFALDETPVKKAKGAAA
jgi:hypothetical protein